MRFFNNLLLCFSTTYLVNSSTSGDRYGLACYLCLNSFVTDERTFKYTVNTHIIFDCSIFADCISMFDVVAWLELSDFWILWKF